jgi:hypothetical protein
MNYRLFNAKLKSVPVNARGGIISRRQLRSDAGGYQTPGQARLKATAKMQNWRNAKKEKCET